MWVLKSFPALNNWTLSSDGCYCMPDTCFLVFGTMLNMPAFCLFDAHKADINDTCRWDCVMRLKPVLFAWHLYRQTCRVPHRLLIMPSQAKGLHRDFNFEHEGRTIEVRGGGQRKPLENGCDGAWTENRQMENHGPPAPAHVPLFSRAPFSVYASPRKRASQTASALKPSVEDSCRNLKDFGIREGGHGFLLKGRGPCRAGLCGFEWDLSVWFEAEKRLGCQQQLCGGRMGLGPDRFAWVKIQLKPLEKSLPVDIWSQRGDWRWGTLGGVEKDLFFPNQHLKTELVNFFINTEMECLS